MRVEYYERVEHDSPFGVEKVKGNRSVAESISSEVCERLEEYVPETFEGYHPIHFVDVTLEDGVVSVDGIVLDVESEMYEEEELDFCDTHRYEFTFEYEEE